MILELILYQIHYDSIQFQSFSVYDFWYFSPCLPRMFPLTGIFYDFSFMYWYILWSVLHLLMRAKYRLSLFNATDVIAVNPFFSTYLYKADMMTVRELGLGDEEVTFPIPKRELVWQVWHGKISRTMMSYLMNVDIDCSGYWRTLR